MPDESQIQSPAQQAGQSQGAATAQQTELMIPKRRYDEVNQLYREAELKLSEMSKQIEGLKTKDDKIAQLEKQIKDMQASYDLEKASAKKVSAIDSAIKDKTVDADVVKKLLDMDKISLDDTGAVKGLDEQLKELQAAKPYLWKKAQTVAQKGSTPATKPEKSFAQRLAEQKVKQLNVVAKSKNYF